MGRVRRSRRARPLLVQVAHEDAETVLIYLEMAVADADADGLEEDIPALERTAESLRARLRRLRDCDMVRGSKPPLPRQEKP